METPADSDLEAYQHERLCVPSADSVTVLVHLDPIAVTQIGVTWAVGETPGLARSWPDKSSQE